MSENLNKNGNKKPCLVTGTAGFIGFSLARDLLEKGRDVIGVDNYTPYYDVRIKRARNKLLEEYPGFKSIEADIADLDAMEKVFEEHKPELVVNLAAQPGVRYSLINPFAYQRSNVQGFLNILELCKRNNVKRLVYASSSSVYGGNTKLPYHEDDRVETPISLYAATKHSNEKFAHAYNHLFRLQTIGLRLFTVYGPWGRPDMAYWMFVKAIMRGEPIKVFNNGDMQRDFTYIDDIVAGIEASMDKPDLPGNIVFNLGNHRSEELLELISILEDALGKKAKKELMPMQPGDVKATYADIELARKMLGFEPKTSIQVGMPKFVEWFLENKELTLRKDEG